MMTTPHILCNSKEHFAQVFRLGLLLGDKLRFAGFCQLGDPIHHFGYICAEKVGKPGHIHPRAILDHIVHKAGNDRMAIHSQLAQHDGHLLRVDVIGFPAFPPLPGMDIPGEGDGFLQKGHFLLGELGRTG